MSRLPKSKTFIRKSLNHEIHFVARFGAAYFVTICCREKGRDQLCHQDISKVIFETATMYDHRCLWYLELMLLMPDHLHALIAIDGDTSLSSTIGNFKRATTKFAHIQWQRNFFDHRLRSDESFEEKATYIRHNPVRAGLIEAEENWPYALDRAQIDVAVR